SCSGLSIALRSASLARACSSDRRSRSAADTRPKSRKDDFHCCATRADNSPTFVRWPLSNRRSSSTADWLSKLSWPRRPHDGQVGEDFFHAPARLQQLLLPARIATPPLDELLVVRQYRREQTTSKHFGARVIGEFLFAEPEQLVHAPAGQAKLPLGFVGTLD